MKTIGYGLMMGVGLSMLVFGQGEAPFVSPQERSAVEKQTEEFYQALQPALVDAAKSTVRVWAGNRRLAYGTVVLDGKRVLSKWSEVARARGPLMVEDAQGKAHAASVVGGYFDEDLVVLSIEGETLPAVKWQKGGVKLGSFLAAAQPNGMSAGFGVVSVMERNLRDQDQAFLGLVGELGYRGKGVRIQEVSSGSGADLAGLKPGQIVLKVGEREISGLMELRNALLAYRPGDKVKLAVQAGEGSQSVEVSLGNRPALPKFPSDRLNQMARMGGELSRVNDGFSRVMQTDMRLSPNQVGGPVVNLKGQVVGVSIARAERTKSMVITSERLEELLKQEPKDLSLAMREQQAERRPMLEQRQMQGLPMGRRNRQLAPDRMRAHMEQMERLLDFMRQEMEQMGDEP